MTKTKLILLLGGACACASWFLDNGVAANRPGETAWPIAVDLVWEQPPGIPPMPGDRVIVRGADGALRLPA